MGRDFSCGVLSLEYRANIIVVAALYHGCGWWSCSDHNYIDFEQENRWKEIDYQRPNNDPFIVPGN